MVGAWLVVVAAGESRRMWPLGSKTWQEVEGRPLIGWTIARLKPWPWRGAVLVVQAADVERAQSLLEAMGCSRWQAVAGASTRAESVWEGLKALREAGAGDSELVLVHDGARPNPSLALVGRVVDALASEAAVVPVLAVGDTVKEVEAGRVMRTVDRRRLGLAQTPQGFRFGALWQAYQQVQVASCTDDAEVAERAGLKVAVVEGELDNRKVTVPEDWAWVRAVSVREAMPGVRVGQGFDVHPLRPGRRLVLGGVEIPHAAGLDGDSDGDVLTHALIDGLLGALHWGDLGSWFPPGTVPEGASSLELLDEVMRSCRLSGVNIQQVDATVVAQAPRLRPYIAAIESRLAEVLGVGADAVSVKATTTDGLGFAGRGEGIAALALVTVALPGDGMPRPQRRPR
ncbi:MAG: 2-C-methyl-D-erythritol 2,4-cyclodiphosphate synthase [Firmicutes bacterium]|nr:2-C-methyl-D-erythritol 2,4-cyclodiphosphate synthase [Bacillota bacterium]